MIDPKSPGGSDAARLRLTELEVVRLLEVAAEQYEEYMRLADLPDTSDPATPTQPHYAWDNPIGLVLTERSRAELG